MSKSLAASLVLLLFPAIIGADGRAEDTRTRAPEWSAGGRESWGLDLDFGANLSEGNVDTFTVYSSASLLKRFDCHYFTLEGSSIYSKFDRNTVLDRVVGFVRYDYLLSDHWRIFVLNTHAYNRFLELDYRITAGAGLWYDIFYRDEFLDGFSVATIYNHEEFNSGARDDKIELSFRNLFTWQLTEQIKLVLDGYYIPSTENWGKDYRLYGLAALEAAVYRQSISLRVSVADEYDNRPQPGVQKNDFTFKTSVAFHFGN